MTMIRTLFATTAALLMLALPSSLKAHPHVWVTVETKILADAKGNITGMRHSWTFDEFFSVFATQGLDVNGDGKFDRKELAALAEENVSSLSEFDFFTFVKAGGKDVALTDPPDDYYLVHKNGLLTLHFTLPLEKQLNARKADLSYAVYDPTFYVDFAYSKKKSPVKLASTAPAGCRVDLKEPKANAAEVTLSEAFYQGLDSASDFGSQFARDVVIDCNAG